MTGRQNMNTEISELNILRETCKQLEAFRDKVVSERMGNDAIGRLFRDENEKVYIVMQGENHIKDGMPVFAQSTFTKVVSMPSLPEPYINEHEDAGSYYPATYSRSQMIQFAKQLLIDAGFEGEVNE